MKVDLMRFLDKCLAWISEDETAADPVTLTGPLDGASLSWQTVLGAWREPLRLPTHEGPTFVLPTPDAMQHYEPVLDALRIFQDQDDGQGLTAVYFAQRMWGRFYDARFAPRRRGAYAGRAGQWLRKLEERGLLRSFEEQSNWKTLRWTLTRKGRATLKKYRGQLTPLQAYRDELENAIHHHERRHGCSVDVDAD